MSIENERLPSELGWTKKEQVISIQDILSVTNIIRNATSLLTDSEAVPHAKKRRDLHAGLGI